jgi:hypothetical protein
MLSSPSAPEATLLEFAEWVVVIVAAAVVTAIFVTVGYLLELSWLSSWAWLLGIATAGVIIYFRHRSDRS